MTYLACLAVGFLAGFAFGFKVAAMIKLGVQQVAPPKVAKQSPDKTCEGCRHDDRISGPVSLVDLRPVQICRLRQRRLWTDRRCQRFAARTVDQVADGSLPQEG